MVNMEYLQLDAFTPEDLAEFKLYAGQGVLGVFIYNKNVYYNGERFQIDKDNYKVRTELRSDISVSPISVFRVFEGCDYSDNTISLGGINVSFKVGDIKFTVNGEIREFSVAPFVYLGHVYVAVSDISDALGLGVLTCNKNRLTLIGNCDVIEQLRVAMKNNPALEITASRETVGYYDAYKFTHEDFVMAKDNWRKLLCATPETIDLNDDGMKARVRAISNSAKDLLSRLHREPDSVILWGDKAPVESDEVMIQFGCIRELAVAWGTYGTDYYHDDSLKKDILYCYEWMYENMYGEAEINGTGWRSINDFNWWHWYVGGPDMLTDGLLIMENEMTEEAKRKYLKLFKYLLDNWRLRYTQDQCSGRMAVGTKCALLLEDPERLTISSNDYHIMLDVVLEGPGTHTDYCNYQHNFPYNMSYGQSNLHRVLRVGSVLSGTPLEFVSPRYYNQYMLFKYMFEAAMYQGRGFMCFLGRGAYHGELNSGIGVLSQIIPMIGNYGPEEALAIKKFIKYSAKDPLNRKMLIDSCSISHHSTIMDILNDDSISDENDYFCAHAWFSADRATLHRDDYAFALSMPSYRHVTYECINHENHQGWYMNEGTLYLYTNNDKNAFDGINFSLNKRLAQRMPGTTVDVRPRPAVSISEGAFSTREKVGCMDFDGKYIVAGMDYECYGRDVGEDDYVDTGYGGGNPKFPNDLVAKKAYFMFDDECVCLGAGINSTMNAEVLTTVEHRRLVKTDSDPLGDDLIHVNGSEMPHGAFEVQFDKPQTAMVEGFAGFIFADAKNVTVSKYLYAIDPKEIKEPITIPDYAQKERPFVEITINHGKNPVDGTYAYAVLPYADAEKVNKYAADPDFEILCNTTKCQAVREKTLGVTGIVFYEAGECYGIKVDKACVVTFSDNDGVFNIKVCEPTNKEEAVSVEIDRPLKLKSADDRYTVECSDVTKLTLDVKLSVGEGYVAEFTQIC